jgi:hypothetical protein
VGLSPGLLDGLNLAPQGGDESFAALAAVAGRLYQAGDPRAAFPEIYGVITREVATELVSPGCGFIEPEAIDELMGVFCARYFETLIWSLDGRAQDCEAWRVAYDHAARRATIPFQDVVLGLSAHINYDLAMGIAQVLVRKGYHRDDEKKTRFKHDHDHINSILRRSLAECFERVIARYGCRFSHLAWNRSRPVTRRVVLSLLSVWRERIWDDVLRLTAAEGEAARRAVLAGMNRRSGLIARAIVAPSSTWLTGERLLPRRVAGAVRARLIAPVGSPGYDGLA